MTNRFANVVLVAILLSAPVASQSGAPHRNSQSIVSSTTAILIDVVVRDKRGKLVTDLATEDFEIAEDGVSQRVDSFTRVSHGSGIGVGVAWKAPNTTIADSTPAADSASARNWPAGRESTTALVFDHLSADSLRLAQRATLDYVPRTGDSDVKIGVFATDPGVRVLQGYTTDRARVRSAVQRLLPAGTAAEDQKADRSDELLMRRRELRGEGEASQVVAPAGGGTMLAQAAAERGQRETELRLVQTELNMIRSFENIDREHKGYDTALALLSVVQSLAYLPGRKTIVFFSEGLPVTPALAARLDLVIDAANRANVTTYALDANGLRTKSNSAGMRREMDAFAEERRVQNATGMVRTDGPLTMAFERVEDMLKIDSRTGLARLAEETGGFLVDQSNDLSSAFQRIDEDSRFHYLLTYSPKNTAFDGKFRSIQVNVRRPGMQVFARKGYRAIRRTPAVDGGGGHETTALALLERAPFPNAFPIHAAGFSFPGPARPGLTPVLVQVSTDALRFTVDQARSTYSAQAVIAVRIRDAKGRDVERLSQHYVLAGDAKDVDAAKQGEILFYREPELPAGVYTMESIVFDPTAGHASARVATLTVPRGDEAALRVSSLIVANRVEQLTDPPSVQGPLYVGRTLLYPNLGQPMRKADVRELPFYFALYGRTAVHEARVELLRNGRAIAEGPMTLPAPTDGRLQHIGRLPVDNLPAGTYELRIRVSDGRREVSRAAFFTLQD